MADDITHTSEDTIEIDEKEFKDLGEFIELKSLAGPLRSIKYLNEFRVALTNPQKMQQNILKEILKKNKDTNYGKLYNFAKIKTIEEYQNLVPVITYEDIIPFIQKIKDGEQNILTKDKVIFLATTSGTTSSVKLIPVTKDRIKNFKRELYKLYINNKTRNGFIFVKQLACYSWTSEEFNMILRRDLRPRKRSSLWETPRSST